MFQKFHDFIFRYNGNILETAYHVKNYDVCFITLQKTIFPKGHGILEGTPASE